MARPRYELKFRDDPKGRGNRWNSLERIRKDRVACERLNPGVEFYIWDSHDKRKVT